jgi:(1->4)-alpha-D-glucan 1-alpha-D-glucosylmutase
MNELRATVRLQFHHNFPLDRATELVPYLHRLGVSHVYASPLLKARPGSAHGYDIVDHNTINPELGGAPALGRLVDTLRRHEMGLILDIVPNHMGVGGADNAWWLDVLEWGRASHYAEFFDIDWDPPDTALRGKLLAPFLGTPYGDALTAGDVKLRFDESDGRFFASAYDVHHFPITPREYPQILRAAGGELDDLLHLFAEPGPGGRDAIRRRAETGREVLRQAYAARPGSFLAALDAHLPETEEGRDRLHRLLERQHYRLAWWRAAADEINWRRFFDINGLAGVRVERPEVFEATHATILQLYADGLIDGVRIDHVDGLADPRGYCRKLRRRLEALREERPPALRDSPPVIWVEKILFPHERLANDWLADGTTGYDFMAQSSAVLHDPGGQEPLTALWTGLTGRPGNFEDEAKLARRQILREVLSSELWATAGALHRIARRNIATRDWTLTGLRRALEELLVHFHTYRIYAGLAGPSATDMRDLTWAMAGARRTMRAADRPLLDLMGRFLGGEGLRSAPPGAQRQEWLRGMVRFQQLSAPTAAKSVEDTAFYRYGRLLSRNEVGSEPSEFALPPPSFHAACRERRRRFPRALLATATHDHKRGEDTRARLAVLSEIPGEWDAALARWTRLNAPLKRDVEGVLSPDSADELMLYQMLVAAWPLDLSPDNQEDLSSFGERIAGWQEKSVREAKRHSGWIAPNVEYETACRDFLSACLDPARPASIVREICAFAARIARAGAVNGLAQTLLRLTCPGVPDLYQGAEFWDFSLVDPDNRRPVDWSVRQEALARNEAPADLLGHWRDGQVKQAIIARTLALRSRMPAVFAEGFYHPLRIEGPAAQHALAFARAHEGRAVISVVPRLVAGWLGPDPDQEGSLLVPESAWEGTALVLPRILAGRPVKNVLGGLDDGHISGRVTGAEAAGRLPLVALFRSLPVALLEVQ